MRFCQQKHENRQRNDRTFALMWQLRAVFQRKVWSVSEKGDRDWEEPSILWLVQLFIAALFNSLKIACPFLNQSGENLKIALYFDYIHLIRKVNGLFICLCLLWLSELLVLQSTGDNKLKTTFTWSTTTIKKKKHSEAIVTSSGQPNMENGNKPEENHVSSTSSSATQQC